MDRSIEKTRNEIGPARADHGISVYLIREEDGRRRVLKQYDRPSLGFRVESDFYRRTADRTFTYLRLPKLLEVGERHLLLEFVPREVYTRDSILERSWSGSDVDLWVNALLEFQQLAPSKRLFSLSRRAVGAIYPIVGTMHQLRQGAHTLTPSQALTVAKLIVAYGFHRPFVTYVCTHFDLQTYNYTFAQDERRMSLLDFEFPYYLGDPFFDVIYYLSIPTCEIPQWTFQKKLLKTFFDRVQDRQGYDAGKKVRTRLLLLLVNMARKKFFRDDREKRAVYEANIAFILDNQAFEAFWSREL